MLSDMRVINNEYVTDSYSLRPTVSFGRKDIYSKLPVAARWAEWVWSGSRTSLKELYLICA